MYFFVSVKFFWFEMARVNVHVFLVSNSADIWVEISKGRHPPPRGAPHRGGKVGRPSHISPLTLNHVKYRLGGTFHPNEVLGMHLAPFLDQQSVLEQQTKNCGMVLFCFPSNFRNYVFEW